MNLRKYLFAFLITVIIFGTAIYLSLILNQRKIDEVKKAETRVSLDILSSETQFSLLEETSCKNISPSGFLSSELGPLGERLSYAEGQNLNKEDVNNLKQSYFLLEIKDYLLMKKVTEKCGQRPTFILYFYGTDKDCPDCEKMGAVLTELRTRYPSLRVYSFDYNFDLAAVQTMEKIYKVEDRLPALIINGDPYYGMKTVDELLTNVPALARLKAEDDKAKAASSTPASTSTRILR
jgi:thiol-disulfide isomerase/thioredoxin